MKKRYPRKPLPPRQRFSAEFIRSILDYDPETGVFRWKITRPKARHKSQIGSLANSINGSGYTVIFICGRHYLASALAWLFVHGHWPEKEMDHINGVIDDNRINNLRPATRAQNTQNRRSFRRTYGKKGVQPRGNGKWRACIAINKRRISLGDFPTEDEAYAAYCDAVAKYHGEFANLSLHAASDP